MLLVLVLKKLFDEKEIVLLHILYKFVFLKKIEITLIEYKD